MEIWKDVKGYEGIYQVSNIGHVKSLQRAVKHSKGGFKILKERILKQSINSRGYYTIGLHLSSKVKTVHTHQLVAIAFLNHNPCGYKLVVNHINHIKTDNRLSNLEIVTQRENANQKHLKSSSQYVGVSYNRSKNRYYSKIRFNGTRKYLGSFKTELEASNAYQKALLSL